MLVLKAIENGQAADLWKLGSNCRPFVVMGDTNTPENRRDIALGKYTHIWISAEAVLGDLVEKKSQEYKPNKSRKVTRWSGCEYEDRGTFTSVVQYTPFRQRLCLVAIDEMHLCAQISWGGSFRPAFSQLSRLRDQSAGSVRTSYSTIWCHCYPTSRYLEGDSRDCPETQPM